MRASLAAVALLALGACTLPQGNASRSFAPYAPLQARIMSPSPGGPIFRVNRPAYVAMFYIVPGGGVSMLYPGFGSGSLDGRVFAGSHFARGRLTHQEQFIFASGGAMAASPRFYFMIASDRPLNVRQFGSFGDGLRSRLGTSFGSFSAYSTMERIARVALPSVVDDGSWTTDMYVEWPNVIGNEPGRGRVLMECGGYVMYVPMAYVQAVQALVCDAQEQAEDEAEEEAVEPVVKPRAREPIPADAQGGQAEEIRTMAPKALVERISSSTQLREPIARANVDGGRDELGRAGARSRPGMSGSNDGGSRGSVGSPASRPTGPASVGSSSGSGSSGPVSAPASRPSSDSGGGGSSGGGGGGSGPVSAPTSRDSGGG